MIYLNRNIILDTISIEIAVVIFSLLSLFCSVITILIYLRVKSLRTIIYKIFFLIAINETISRIFHIIEFLNRTLKFYILGEINIIAIYFTDTNILIFLATACYTMYELILKQNKKINSQFPLIVKIIFIVSTIFTILFFFLSLDEDDQQNRHKDLYKNAISLHFIRDEDKKDKQITPIIINSILYLLLGIYTFYKVILIEIFIRKRGDINEGEEDINSESKKRQKTIKLKTFRNKILQYPIIGFGFYFPLLAYSWIEFTKNVNSTNDNSTQGDDTEDQLYNLRIRYIFYNINCFMNSIRGWMYFTIFISNEKIKLYLFKRYLTSSIFYTIDKIDKDREINKTSIRSSSIYSADGTHSVVNKINTINSESSDDELAELNKEYSDDFNVNNNKEENDINPKTSHDSKSESLKKISNLMNK